MAWGRGLFTQRYGDGALDVSLLLVPLLRFLPSAAGGHLFGGVLHFFAGLAIWSDRGGSVTYYITLWFG